MKNYVVILLLVLVSIVLIFIAFLNLTPGQFGYADNDGCACTVSYNTSTQMESCNSSRANQCDFTLDKPLLLFNFLDFNR